MWSVCVACIRKGRILIVMARTEYLTVRLTLRERSRYERIANDKGITVSEWVRLAAEKQADRDEELSDVN